MEPLRTDDDDFALLVLSHPFLYTFLDLESTDDDLMLLNWSYPFLYTLLQEVAVVG